MATPRVVEVRVSRKLSQSYNSTEYACSVTLDLTEREGAIQDRVPELIKEWTETLRGCIRKEFAPNGHRAGALAANGSSTDDLAQTRLNNRVAEGASHAD